MNKFIWVLLLIILSTGLYFALAHPNASIPSNSPIISMEESSTSLKQAKPIDTQKNEIKNKVIANSRKVTPITRSDNETNSNSNDVSISLDEQLKELQKLPIIDLSEIDEGLKYALLNGSAKITPEGDLSYGVESTYVSDMQAHPSMGIGILPKDYFAQDSNKTQWARDTENQISAALNKLEFIEQFSDLVVYDFSCKDTMCRISFTGRFAVSSRMTKHFSYIPALGTHYGGRATSMGFDDNGNSHVYVYRNMIKEPEY